MDFFCLAFEIMPKRKYLSLYNRLVGWLVSAFTPETNLSTVCSEAELNFLFQVASVWVSDPYQDREGRRIPSLFGLVLKPPGFESSQRK